MSERADAQRTLDAMVKYLVDNVRVKIPNHLFDGTEVKTAEDVVAALGIPRAEAELRLRRCFPDRRQPEQKDVHSRSGEYASTRGVGTVIERAAAIAYGKRRKPKKRRAK